VHRFATQSLREGPRRAAVDGASARGLELMHWVA